MMARKINYGESQGLRLSGEMAEQVERFRREGAYPDRAMALRVLVTLGLIYDDVARYENEITGTVRVPKHWVNRSVLPPLERQKGS